MRRWIAGGVALVLSGCLGGDGEPGPLEESFEQGFGDWRQDSDLPEDPDRPGRPVSAGTSISDRARSGEHAVRFHLDGRQDDGTVWLERTLEQEPGTYRFDVSFWAWGESESFNTLAHAVAYLGPDDPEREADFPAPMENSARDELGFGGLREPLDRAAGWEAYNFTWEGEVPPSGQIRIALGISAVWETEMTYDMDDLVVRAAPVSPDD